MYFLCILYVFVTLSRIVLGQEGIFDRKFSPVRNISVGILKYFFFCWNIAYL